MNEFLSMRVNCLPVKNIIICLAGTKNITTCLAGTGGLWWYTYCRTVYTCRSYVYCTRYIVSCSSRRLANSLRCARIKCCFNEAGFCHETVRGFTLDGEIISGTATTPTRNYANPNPNPNPNPMPNPNPGACLIAVCGGIIVLEKALLIVALRAHARIVACTGSSTRDTFFCVELYLLATCCTLCAQLLNT